MGCTSAHGSRDPLRCTLLDKRNLRTALFAGGTDERLEAEALRHHVVNVNLFNAGILQDQADVARQALPWLDERVQVVDLGSDSSRIATESLDDLGSCFKLARELLCRPRAVLGVNDDRAGLSVGTDPGERRVSDNGDRVAGYRVGQAAPQGPTAFYILESLDRGSGVIDAPGEKCFEIAGCDA